MVWGDHSSLLANGVLIYTVKVIFSTKIFYTDEEMLQKFGVTINVQSVVEQPQIYIFSHCADTIAEKLSLITLRREDILKLRIPMYFGNIQVHDIMRFFIGMFLCFLCGPTWRPFKSCLAFSFGKIF